MIGLLHGTIALRDDSSLIIDTGGVGYKVVVAKYVFAKGAVVGSNITLFTYTHVRDDALELYGFLTPEDLKLFERLISVSGVGPKTALSIFSLNTSKEIIEAIISGNVEFFASVPRLGKKNAQKIIIELRSKFETGDSVDLINGEAGERGEVFEALKSFGFTAREIQQALRQVGGKAQTTEEKIKMALKYLGK